MKPISASAATLSAPVQGALWMAGAAVCFSGMIMLLRLATDALHPFQVAFFRNLFGFGFMLPWILRTGIAGLRTHRLGTYSWRAVTGLMAMLCWFMAISLMPVAEAVALSFTAPLFATIGAAPVPRRDRARPALVGHRGRVSRRPGDRASGRGGGLDRVDPGSALRRGPPRRQCSS